MIEKHPYGSFVPKNSKCLFLGTFTGKPEPEYDWFFATKRNQFWPMMEIVFETKLDTTEKKKDLFTKLRMAITDIILSCERSEGTNADKNLVNFSYNTNVINKIIEENNIQKIYFSSRMAEKLFRKVFKDTILEHPEVELITLPSPSSRYALISKAEKIARYKQLLPRLER